MVKVLFVCTGNICRSPTAEGVFRKLVADTNLSGQIEVDSAGTGAWHINQAPDRRSQEAALRRDVDISQQRARQVVQGDFPRFNHILAMDEHNFDRLARLCPKEFKTRLKLFLEYAPDLDQREVPDPYYGGTDGFETVLDLIETASQGLLRDIRSRRT